MKIINKLKKYNKGSMLVIAVTFILIVAFSVGGLLSYVSSMHTANERVIALEKAEQTAEAGIHQLIHYFNPPVGTDELKSINDPNNLYSKVNTFFNEMIAQKGEGKIPNQATIRDSIGGLPWVIIDVKNGINPDLIKLNNGKVTELKVTMPQPGKHAPSATIFTFECTANSTTTRGDTVKRTVYMHVNFDVYSKFPINGGIVGAGNVSGNGHINLHWGEAWANQNISLAVLKRSSTKKDPYPSWGYDGTYANLVTRAPDSKTGLVDKWVAYKTTAQIVDVNNSILTNDVTTDNLNLYNLMSVKNADFTDLLFQNMDDAFLKQVTDTINDYAEVDGTGLGPTDHGYNFWKKAAAKRGTYYRVASDGYVYDIAGNRMNYKNAAEAFDAYRKLSDSSTIGIAFFDTKDGTYPKSDKSNWADIKFAGNTNKCTKGLLYVAGNLDLGSIPGVDTKVLNPDEIDAGKTEAEASTTLNLFHKGAIFTEGDFKYDGGSYIYGAVIAKGSYNSSGNPNIYYDARLKRGLILFSTPANILSVYAPSGAGS